MTYDCPTCGKKVPESFPECPFCAEGAPAPEYEEYVSARVDYWRVGYRGGKLRFGGMGIFTVTDTGVELSGEIHHGKRRVRKKKQSGVDWEIAWFMFFQFFALFLAPLAWIFNAHGGYPIEGGGGGTSAVPSETIELPIDDIVLLGHDPRLQRIVVLAHCQPEATDMKELYSFTFRPETGGGKEARRIADALEAKFPETFRRTKLPTYGWRHIVAGFGLAILALAVASIPFVVWAIAVALDK